MILQNLLKRLVKTGDLTVTDWKGRIDRYGDGTKPKSHVKINSFSAAMKIALDPDLQLGEAYMSGELQMLEGSLYDFLELLLINTGNGSRNINAHSFMHRMMYRGRIATRRIAQRNTEVRAKKNTQVHYDLSGALYELFLDRDKQYTCAYFENDNSTLEEAQLAKKRHVAAKLDIKPGMTVLDIGCGWGGLGLYLAEVCGAKVTGVTLSEEQQAVAVERAKERGMEDVAQFKLMDYRHVTEKFDRIVSVGMFEAVGVGHFKEFFAKVSELLKPNGTVLLHSINRADGPGATGAWINKYIFPGGYIPALSEVMPDLERHGLYVTDIEILRMHYARTLREWTSRFMANWDKAKALYDERFCRMWEFYLVSSELTFRYISMNNFQIQFGHDQHFLPVTRDYMFAEEKRLAAIEAKSKHYNAKAIYPDDAKPAVKKAAKKVAAPKKAKKK